MNLHYLAIQIVFQGKLFLAPIDDPRSILDVGTGTGIWAINVADRYLSARVVGTDLSPIQPKYVPPNVEFELYDMDDDWNMDDRYDLIHTRNYYYSVRSWSKFYAQAFRSLKSGGWVENQEFDLDFRSDDKTVDKDGPTVRWCQLMNEGFVKTETSGRLNPDEMKQQMEAIGFINCQIVPKKLPIGPWPRD
jgi:SAM-dependent methyltransferase